MSIKSQVHFKFVNFLTNLKDKSILGIVACTLDT